MASRKEARAKTERLVERWRGSGPSAAALARAHCVSPAKFFYWKRRVETDGFEEARARRSVPKFLPVRVISALSTERARPEVALNMALSQRKPSNRIHHSDQGSQYTSIGFGIRPSMASVGDCYDNALCESLEGTLSVACQGFERTCASGSKRRRILHGF